MEKLVITVAADSRTSYPNNHYCPPNKDVKSVAEHYVESINAGAAVAHIHGVRELEAEIQPDGRRVSRLDFEGWKALQEGILDRVDAVMQFGVASARIEEKVHLMELKPDMMSVCFNAHDERFQPDPAFPPNMMYAIHPQDELLQYAREANAHGVKLEVESFHTGAFWNMEFVRKQVSLGTPTYTTLFLGWPGGTWTPPTEKALIYMVDHLPKDCVWNVSVMNPEMHWRLLALAISLGGHVRVGWEDNPYLEPGVLAERCSRLVDKIVGIAGALGRDIANPAEARKIFGLPERG